MIRLYVDEPGEYLTLEGMQINKELMNLLQPVFDKCVEQGYSLIDLEYAVNSSASLIATYSKAKSLMKERNKQ